MDLSEIKLSASPKASASNEPGDAQRWRDLVGEIGAEVAAPLTAALERIQALATSGQIDRQSLRALRDEVEKAREVGMGGQQLSRIASGRVRQSHERLPLTETLQGVLTHRARETHARGIEMKPLTSRPVDVIADASLLFGLLNTMLDWALACARSSIGLRIDVKAWPSHARLVCHFAHRPVDQLDDGAATPGEVSLLDSMHWRLLQQTAWAMGLPLERTIDGSGTTLAIEFPRTVNDSMEGASAVEIDDGFAPSINTKPLAGSHVLVVARRREVRLQVRDALRDMGLIVDFVGSVEEAADFSSEGLPHAIVVESALCGERFDALKKDITTELPLFVFIEIVEDAHAFEMSEFGALSVARVGRETLAKSLPSALLFELSRGL